MDVFTALRDDPGLNMSMLIGVFSTEELARAGCQEDLDEDDQASGEPARQLQWTDDRAVLPDNSVYTVVMTRLDIRTGMG